MLLLFVDCCIVIFLLYPLLTPLLARHCHLSPNHRPIKSSSTTLSHDASHPPWAYVVSRPSVTMAFSPSSSPAPAMARHPSSPPSPPTSHTFLSLTPSSCFGLRLAMMCHVFSRLLRSTPINRGPWHHQEGLPAQSFDCCVRPSIKGILQFHQNGREALGISGRIGFRLISKCAW